MSRLAALTRSSARAPGRMRNLASDDLLRSAFANTVGMTYEGADGLYRRDIYAQLGYKRDIRFKDYEKRYERGGIAKRIVEVLPNLTWATGVKITEDGNDKDDTEFELALTKLFTRLQIWNKLLRADILAGIHKYSVLLIGGPGALDTRLGRVPGPLSIKHLQPLRESKASIKTWNTKNKSSERYRLPQMYSVDLGQGIATQDVHWSRVIHVAEACGESDVYGEPRLRAPWNYLDDLEKLHGAGSEAAWKRSDPGMQLDLDPETQLTSEQETALSDEVEDYQHNLTKVLRTRGVDLKLLAAEVQAFGGNVDSELKLISATIDVPMRVLLGTESGELASSKDTQRVNDKVSNRREVFAEPLVRQLVDRFTLVGALPQVDSYSFDWSDIDELDEKAKAEVGNKIANANSSQYASEGKVIVTANEIRTRVFGLPAAEDADLIGLRTDGGDSDSASGESSIADIELKQ